MSSSKKILVSCVAAALTMASAGAFAQDRYGNPYDPRHEGGYEGPDAGYDYAKVVDVEPLTTRVRVTTPQRNAGTKRATTTAAIRRVDTASRLRVTPSSAP